MYVLIQETASEWGFALCAVPVEHGYIKKLLAYIDLITALNHLDSDLDALHVGDWSADWYSVDREDWDFSNATHKIVSKLPESAVLMEDADKPIAVVMPHWVYWQTISEDGRTLTSRLLLRKELENMLEQARCGS